MAFSEKQREYLLNCNHRWNLKVGATGSGKTWLDYAVVIPKRIMALKGEGQVLLLGNTQGTINRNVIEPMREIWGEEMVSIIHGNNTVTLFGRNCYILGADKKTSVAKIQGMTVEYGYGDEMTTWNEEVFQMLKSRLRCSHSHFDGTMNPSDPNNFMKKFIDSNADIYCQYSVIDDNTFLPKEFIDNLKREYTGTIYYNRFILGQWIFAEGIIYPIFAEAVQQRDNRFRLDKINKSNIQKIVVGVDFGGTSSAHAFCATAHMVDGSIVALASARVNAAGTDSESLNKRFYEFCSIVFNTWGEIKHVFCDSAEQVLIQSTRNYLLKTNMAWLSNRIYNAVKMEITERIRLQTLLIGGGRFFYLDTADTLKSALASCVWRGDKTKDERLDNGSTDVDSLDAYEYTIERDYRRLLKWT